MQIIYKNIIIFAYIVPASHENMKKDDYFKEIAEKVHERRTKGEYSKLEFEAYHSGKEEAFKEVLNLLNPKGSDIYYTHRYTKDELWKFVELNISDMKSRLKKARKIYLGQLQIIENLSQLQID